MAKRYQHVPTGRLFLLGTGANKDLLQETNGASFVPMWTTKGSKDWKLIDTFQSNHCVILEIRIDSTRKFVRNDQGNYIIPNSIGSPRTLESAFATVGKTGQILAVKRTTDNIILRIGSQIILTHLPTEPVVEVTGFFIPWEDEEGDVWVRTSGHYPNIRLTADVEIRTAPRKEIFVSEDGVKIFDGDSWYYVTDEFKSVASTNTLAYTGTKTNKVFRFAKREAADLFLIKNKKLLSVADIEVIIKGSKNAQQKRDTLIGIVKTRM